VKTARTASMWHKWRWVVVGLVCVMACGSEEVSKAAGRAATLRQAQGRPRESSVSRGRESAGRGG
jgi:hypothetical protein